MITTELDLMTAIDQVVKAGAEITFKSSGLRDYAEFRIVKCVGNQLFRTSRIIESNKQLNHQIIFSLRTLEQLIEGTSGTERPRTPIHLVE
jgi:hypothetical protein